MMRSFTPLYILGLFAILAIPSPVEALEKSSKRDCAICHVMWLDDFRMAKETLIEWQPGSVLMKDTQGVVSAEANCYSCHDGYVVDSRYVVGQHNQHQTFVKPSKKISVPATLPLSNKDEIYCGTCHTAHGPGAPPAGDLPAPASFFRVRSVDSGLCEMCHRQETAFKRNNGHPLKTTALKLPDVLDGWGAKRAPERNKVICQSCHKLHGAKGDKITLIDNRDSELCTACHTRQKGLVGGKHDLRLSLPHEKNIRQQPTSKTGPCSACHTPHNAAGKMLWAKRLKPGSSASGKCLVCHAEEGGYQIKRIGRHSHPVDVKLAAQNPLPAELPLYSADGTKNSTGSVQCFTCHDPHRWDPQTIRNTGAKNIEGDSSNSFLRLANNISSTLCLTCHADQKPVVASDHNLAITAPNAKNIRQFNARESGPCGACHIPHNATGNKLWARKQASGNFASQACLTCHGPDAAVDAKRIGPYSHPIDVDTGSNGSVSAELPLFSKTGAKSKSTGGSIQCFTCHDVHRWDPHRSIDPVGKNLEGDATNSFLRKANFPSSELCNTCHPDQALVEGTDHDLSVTAPAATNLLGQTVEASGACGACHLVHNSSNQLKLWARSYGPVSEQVSMMNALCRSCHAKDRVAEAKVPVVTFHPEGKLTSNIASRVRQGVNWAPIYSKSGEERNVGYIACPTCHNGHQWSPFLKKKGTNKNLEGNAKTSFLRNLSSKTLCSECHGIDGLFRYKYFHAPRKKGGIGDHQKNVAPK